MWLTLFIHVQKYPLSTEALSVAFIAARCLECPIRGVNWVNQAANPSANKALGHFTCTNGAVVSHPLHHHAAMHPSVGPRGQSARLACPLNLPSHPRCTGPPLQPLFHQRPQQHMVHAPDCPGGPEGADHQPREAAPNPFTAYPDTRCCHSHPAFGTGPGGIYGNCGSMRMHSALSA